MSEIIGRWKFTQKTRLAENCYHLNLEGVIIPAGMEFASIVVNYENSFAYHGRRMRWYERI